MLTAIMVVATLLAACAPATRPGEDPQSSGSGSTVAQSQPAAPKLLTIALNKEPATIQGFTSGGSSSARGNSETPFVHNMLVVQDSDDAWHPQLAAEVPNFDDGSWRLNADGSMDVAWKLRPGVTWHDGTPFTSADLLFTLDVYKNPDLAQPYTALAKLMESATAPDPGTFTVHWSKFDSRASQGLGLSPLPKHLLEELYRGSDIEAFANSPRFTDDFVGLGPYRMERWEHGSQMRFTRFDSYYQGRPPLDTIIMRYINDPNAMVANVLSHAVDLILPPSVDMDAALLLRQQSASNGLTVAISPRSWFIYIEMQRRPEIAVPKEGFNNLLVRQAFSYGTNKQALVDVMTVGSSVTADSWVRPGNPLRAPVESAIPQYPYDPNRAQQLLAQAGWTKGADGMLMHAPSGERFASQLWSNTKVLTNGEKQSSIVAQDWKVLGADFAAFPIPAALDNDREYGVKYPTASITNTPNYQSESDWLPRLYSRNVASQANSFSGRNKMGYANAKVDGLIDRLTLAVEPRDQAQITRDLLQEVLGDAAYIPLYWEAHPIIFWNGVKATTQTENAGWDAFTWDKS